MRAPYNVTAREYPYPLGGVWGPPTGLIHIGRLVPQTRIIPGSGPLDDCFWYFTTNEAIGTPSRTSTIGDPQLVCGMGVARGLAIPADDAPRFVVLQVDVVAFPSEGGWYYRYHLIETTF